VNAGCGLSRAKLSIKPAATGWGNRPRRDRKPAAAPPNFAPSSVTLSEIMRGYYAAGRAAGLDRVSFIIFCLSLGPGRHVFCGR
jgi:hypothetical protein